MHDARLGLGVEMHCDDRAIEEAGGDGVAVRRGADRDTEVLLREDWGALVSLELANFDFAVSEANNELSMALIWPCHARDGGILGKLVADSLLITPLGAETVDKDNAVGLRNG